MAFASFVTNEPVACHSNYSRCRAQRMTAHAANDGSNHGRSTLNRGLSTLRSGGRVRRDASISRQSSLNDPAPAAVPALQLVTPATITKAEPPAPTVPPPTEEVSASSQAEAKQEGTGASEATGLVCRGRACPDPNPYLSPNLNPNPNPNPSNLAPALL